MSDDVYMVQPDETPQVYIFPANLTTEEWPMPDDFWERVRAGLASVGLDYETV